MINSKYTYRVAVYFKGDDLAPEDLTARLGAEPTQSHRKGEKWLTSTNREVVEKTGLWSLSVDAGFNDLSAIFNDLVSKIKRRGVALVQLPGVDEAYLDVFMAADADDDGGGTCEFDLDEQCILILSELGLPVRFTIAVVRE